MNFKFLYFVRETIVNLRRNVFMTTAAIVVVAVSLALVGGALLLKQGVDKATIQWKGGVEGSIFMKADAAPEEIDAVDRELRAMPEVKKVRFVTKQGAYDEFRKMFSNSPDMLETLNVDQMPPSFRVVPRQAQQIDVIGGRFKDRPAVRHVELFHEFAVSTNEVVGTGIFLVVVGMLVGAVGSAIAVSRFLDV